jgi:hypothetical protein
MPKKSAKKKAARKAAAPEATAHHEPEPAPSWATPSHEEPAAAPSWEHHGSGSEGGN